MSAKINKRSAKWYGWLPDLPDHRDFSYSAIAPRLAELPAKIDLRKKCSPVENQGELGSCTANALVGALEFLELKDGCRFVDLSRLLFTTTSARSKGRSSRIAALFCATELSHSPNKASARNKNGRIAFVILQKSRPQSVIRTRRNIRSPLTIASARLRKCGPVWPTAIRS